ncbi:purine-nucleoside phosphorylase [Tsukamurella serpentis]
MPTPHNTAEPGDFAPVVLMPGDPRRARRIAETLFDDARLVNEVRGMEAYTGTVGGRPISVMGSGMGMPTMTIYATELFREYGVQRIVRVGTSGAYQDDTRLGDVIVVTAAHTDSAINEPRVPGVRLAPAASFPLLRAAVGAAERRGIPVQVGTVFSSDHFYLAREGLHSELRDHGTLCVDMETAGLYGVAAAEGGQALTVLTVTDHLFRGEAISPQERESGFSNAAQIAIEAAFS